MKKIHLKYDNLKKGLLLAGFVLIILYFLLFIVRHYQDIAAVFSAKQPLEDFEAHFKARTLLNFILLILLTAVTAAIPFMSNAVFAVFNGVVFGPLLGFVMNLSSNVIGNFFLIQVMKRVNIADKDSRFQKRLAEWEAFENKTTALIIGYMLPIIPTFIIDYNVTKMRISWKHWLLCALIGVAPTSLLYAFGGDAILSGNIKRLAVILVIMILVYGSYRYFKKRKEK
ncbi:VTT domain-containing protein [Streptococcus pantholopis]|uniref:VTT domain-containing protein n=1 Tax=Streptococcus pantholopis TaxID=1811193 RepID=A0A172Q6F0_9STRE|nr:VTT domain-containing protein [Streptococcus pantholopis]AND79073.1 hypothetical protein A0O21_03060 [Streptococcus pantholopis]